MSDRVSIIDTINNDDKFSTFARMLRTSKTAALITGAGPFTVFAPTNDAFGKVPDAQMNGWLSQADQTNLAKVLSYHIVPAKLFASNLDGKGPVATLSGAEVTFTDTNGLKVNKSGILARNIEATNGVVHALDTVLTPPANTMAASATANTPATSPTTHADSNSEVPGANTETTHNAVPATPSATRSSLL